MKDNPTRVAVAMRLYMASNGESARQLAPHIGMNHVALSRFLQGKEVSTRHFLAILNYLMGTVYPPSQPEEG